MTRRRSTNRLHIGRYLGIDLFIHWTFWLLLGAVGLSSLFDGGWSTTVGWLAAAAAMTQVAVLFVCVTLHEYGHAMMARRFGVRTVDITLLPIGGLARLERMPRKPIQEFLVAIAGPAVNVVIASLSVIALIVLTQTGAMTWGSDWEMTLVQHPLGWLMLVNTALVVFNMIPAFPMDGGRVFRSFLAAFLDYGRATRIASRVGFVVALTMGALGLMGGYVTVVLIALFIAYAGWVEARQVAMSEAMRGLRVEDWVESPPTPLTPYETLDAIAERFTTGADPRLPVVGMDRHLLGVIERDRVRSAAEQDRWEATAADLLVDDASSLEAPGLVEPQLAGLTAAPGGPLFVCDPQGRLIGVLRLERLLGRVLQRRRQKPGTAEQPIEAVLVHPAPQVGTPRRGILRDSYT